MEWQLRYAVYQLSADKFRTNIRTIQYDCRIINKTIPSIHKFPYKANRKYKCMHNIQL